MFASYDNRFNAFFLVEMDKISRALVGKDGNSDFLEVRKSCHCVEGYRSVNNCSHY